MTRVGVRSTPWSGMQLQSSMNREFGEYGPRVFANVGLTQAFKVGEAWAMDFGVDRSDTITGAGAERFNPNVPLVSGAMGGDYTATYVGAQYRADVWTITTRLERRDSDIDQRRSFTSGFFREPLSGRALSVTTRWLDNETAIGDGHIADARVSYAYRPSEGRFIVLERLDLVEDDRTDLLTSFETSRLVNNVNLHWQIGQLFEFGTQLDVVENFAVENGPERAGFVGERLLAGGKINDREPRMGESCARRAIDAELIRPAVMQRACHAQQRVAGWGRALSRAVQFDDARDAAHGVSDFIHRVHQQRVGMQVSRRAALGLDVPVDALNLLRCEL